MDKSIVSKIIRYEDPILLEFKSSELNEVTRVRFIFTPKYER